MPKKAELQDQLDRTLKSLVRSKKTAKRLKATVEAQAETIDRYEAADVKRDKANRSRERQLKRELDKRKVRDRKLIQSGGAAEKPLTLKEFNSRDDSVELRGKKQRDALLKAKAENANLKVENDRLATELLALKSELGLREPSKGSDPLNSPPHDAARH